MKKTNLLKGIFEIVLLVAVIFTISRICVLKSEDGYTQIKSFYKQKENTVDALFLGSSKIYSQIDTGILWEEYGIAAFDLGGAEATTWNSYYYLEEALKTQKPSVIIYDAGVLGYLPYVEHQDTNWVITNNYGMKWNQNRINQLEENADGKDVFRSLLIPLGSMHSRYSELSKKDFTDYHREESYKGFDVKPFTTPQEMLDRSNVKEMTPLSERQQLYFEKMIELAKSHNIPFTVVISPYVISEDEKKVFNYVGWLCEEKDVEYIDFNNMYNELGLDFSSDYAESLHLNYAGTKKYTEYIGEYLCDNYEMTDHRGDVRYSSWDENALILRHGRLNYELNMTSDEDRIWEILKDRNYVAFIVNNQNELDVMNGDEKMLHLSGVQESKNMLELDNMKAIVYRDEAGCKLNINRKEYEIGWPWSYLVVYDTVIDEVVCSRNITSR